MEPTVHDLLMWADEIELSCAQIQKAYDWRIEQWGAFANAILTAILGLLSSALFETYKQTLKLPYFWSWVAVGTLAYCCIYAFCRFRIASLRREFLTLFTLLLEIK